MGRKRHLFLCVIASVLLTLLFINQRKNSVVISKLKVLTFSYLKIKIFNPIVILEGGIQCTNV